MTASWALAAGAAFAVALAVPAALDAQQAERVIEGRVVRPAGGSGAEESLVGVGGSWVVLHRVGRDVAGPLDSMRTRGDGSYAFRYRVTGDTSAVYFVSTSRGGVAYFTPPQREPVVRGGTAEIMVYDTTSAPIPITVRGRHVIVTAPDSTSDRRTIIEVYEVTNDSNVTRVARGTAGVTFDVPLPDGITAITGGEGDISSESMQVVDGRLQVSAPFSPGLKQFSFFYEIPATADPFTFAVETDVPVVEVLVEDPRGTARGAGLVEVSPVEVEGRPFKRFLGEGVGAGSTFIVTTPGDDPGVGRLRVMLVVIAIGAAMLLGLGMAFLRKGPRAFAPRRDADPASLALQVAALDAAYEKLTAPTEQQRAEHYVARAQLKGRLSAALAKRDELG